MNTNVLINPQIFGNEFKYPVVPIDEADEAFLFGGPNALKLAGGFAACTFTVQPEQIATFVGQAINNAGRFLEGLDQTQPMAIPVIFVSLPFLQGLGVTDARAVIYHEEGHIVNGDLAQEIKPDSPRMVGGKTAIVTSEEIELNADAYAATKVGKESLRKALKKVIAFRLQWMFARSRQKGGWSRILRDMVAVYLFVSAETNKATRARYTALM